MVSDIERKRPIWFGGKDRSKESLDIFFQQLGANKTKKIRLAVMDMPACAEGRQVEGI